MKAEPTVLAVLRHALADPLSAATVKAEVLTSRLMREAPALVERARDLGADLGAAGRLLDLLAPLAAIAEEAPETTTIGALLAPFGGKAGAGGSDALVRVRPAAAADAIRRVVAFGASRGGDPAVAARRAPRGGEVVVERLGPAPAPPLERLLLLPRDVPGAEELYLAHAAVVADGGSLGLARRDGSLEAVLGWPGREGG